MTFSPVLPIGGYAGWAFLKRTQETQTEAFESAPQLKRDEEYFRENINKITSAEELVDDYRLLRVALGAFGLDDQLPNKFFIKKILEEGTTDPQSLANRLSNAQFSKFSKAFGFGRLEIPQTLQPNFADRIIEKYKDKQFEEAIGEINGDMRLALNLERELTELASSDGSNDTKWFRVMGSNPLRKIFETIYSLPAAFGSLDVDKQLETFKNLTSATFGDDKIDQFSDPEEMEKLIRRFMLRSEINESSSLSSRQIALNLLQNG